MDPHFLSLAALVLAGLSLAVSLRTLMRDRAQVRAECWVTHPPPEHMYRQYGVGLRVENRGRRTARVCYLVGRYGKEVKKYPIGESDEGVTIGEQGAHSMYLTMHSEWEMLGGSDDPQEVSEFWVEDGLRQRYRVKGSRKVLAEFWTRQKALMKQEERRKLLVTHQEKPAS